MVECKDFDEKLLDYLYEELSPAERQACEQHLAGCVRCQGELSSFGGVRRAAQQLELVEPPAAVSAKLMYQAAQLAPRRRGGKVLPLVRKILQHPAYAMAACFLIVGGLTSWQLIVHGELPMATPAVQGKLSSSEKGGQGEAEARQEPVAVATPTAAPQAPAAPAEEAYQPKPEPMLFDKKGSRKVIASPSKGLSEDSAGDLAKGPKYVSGAAPKAALAQEGYRPAPSAADGEQLLDSISGLEKKADKSRSETGGSLSLKNERPATILSGKASRGRADDDAPALPEIQRQAPAQEAPSRTAGGGLGPQTIQLPLAKDQNQQLARDTLPQPPETRSRSVKPSAAKPVDRELQVSNERNSAASTPAAVQREEAPAGAAAAPAPPPSRSDNNLVQGQAPANRLAGNLGEDAACREVEQRLQTEGQARVSAEELWTDYLCLKRRGQTASARAQGDLRRLARDFPSFRTNEVLAERLENDMPDERNQRQLEGWEPSQRAKKAKRAAPKQSESNKAY
ncbi:MAG TPA: zf-HC2 domain-containing protein [Polyangia bacterium]|jgi:hypothetical protein|nr:zf-HC2 domain-containing protein [Polyangia bacterium]